MTQGTSSSRGGGSTKRLRAKQVLKKVPTPIDPTPEQDDPSKIVEREDGTFEVPQFKKPFDLAPKRNSEKVGTLTGEAKVKYDEFRLEGINRLKKVEYAYLAPTTLPLSLYGKTNLSEWEVREETADRKSAGIG